MWAEFEWENKVVVNTEFRNLRQYMDHILKNTNMKYVSHDLCPMDASKNQEVVHGPMNPPSGFQAVQD